MCTLFSVVCFTLIAIALSIECCIWFYFYRYFGGIKLGTGGLVRAYGGVASECLKNAPTCLVKSRVLAPFSFMQDVLFNYCFRKQRDRERKELPYTRPFLVAIHSISIIKWTRVLFLCHIFGTRRLSLQNLGTKAHKCLNKFQLIWVKSVLFFAPVNHFIFCIIRTFNYMILSFLSSR